MFLKVGLFFAYDGPQFVIRPDMEFSGSFKIAHKPALPGTAFQFPGYL
jgi:hypothetical protein